MQGASVIEAMLLRWCESHNGRTVTLQLPSEGDHPFRGLPCGPANGQRLAIAVALINDDETTTAVEAEGGDTRPGKSPPGTYSKADWSNRAQASEKPVGGVNGEGHEMPRGGRRAREAGIACGEGAFVRFLVDCCDWFRNDFVWSDAGVLDAPATVRAICGVTSRAALDHDATAAAVWDELHGRYIAWREAA
jgi:hypothetical protein